MNLLNVILGKCDVDRMGCTECKGRGVACPAVGSDVVEVHHEGN